MIQKYPVNPTWMRNLAGEVGDMGCRTINVAFMVSRREELRGDNLADDERICSKSTVGQVEEPLNDDDDDLLSESVVCAPNGDTNLNFGDDLGYLEEGGGRWRSYL